MVVERGGARGDPPPASMPHEQTRTLEIEIAVGQF